MVTPARAVRTVLSAGAMVAALLPAVAAAQQSLPDLAIRVVAARADGRFAVEILNRGAADAPAAMWEITWRGGDDVLLGGPVVGRSDALRSGYALHTTIAGPSDDVRGVAQLMLTIDAGNVVAEEDETNNSVVWDIATHAVVPPVPIAPPPQSVVRSATVTAPDARNVITPPIPAPAPRSLREVVRVAPPTRRSMSAPQRPRPRIVERMLTPVVHAIAAVAGATPVRAEDDVRTAFLHDRGVKQPTVTNVPTTTIAAPATSMTVPLPNLTIASTWFQIEGNLIIRYANTGSAALPSQRMVFAQPQSDLSFWFAWADADGDAFSTPGWYWMDTAIRTPAAGAEESLHIEPTSAYQFFPHGRSASDTAYAKDLAAFLRTQPKGATQLLVLVDGPNAYVESDDDDNMSAAVLLQPNLRLRDAVLAPDNTSLTFTFENRGATSIWPPAGRERVSIGFSFAWHDATGQPVRDVPSYTSGWAYTGIAAGSAPQLVLRDSTAWRFNSVGGSTVLTFTDLLRTAPPSGRTLVMTADEKNAVAEIHEDDNAVTVSIPQLPNVRVVAEDTGNGDFTFGYENVGVGAIPLPAGSDRVPVALWFAWADTFGAPLPTTTWYWDDLPTSAAGRLPGGYLRRLYRDDEHHLGIRRRGDPVTAATRLTIGDVLREAPDGAAQLIVMADGPSSIVEQDETDNTATLAVAIPRPNLRAILRDNGNGDFIIGFENAGTATIPLDAEGDHATISLWFALADASGNPLPTTTWYWDDVGLDAASRSRLVGGEFSRLYRDDEHHLGIRRHGDPVTAETRRTIGDVFREAPTDAARLLVRADGPNVIGESDEMDNIATLAVTIPRPDLRPIAWQEYQREDDGGFSVRFGNVGAVGVPTRRGASADVPVSVWFAWGDATGRPSPSTPWYWRDDFVVQASELVPGYASRGFRVRADQSRIHRWGDAADAPSITLPDVLAGRPSGATHLLAFIDGANRIVESSEGNNVLAVPMAEQGQEREQEPEPTSAPTPSSSQPVPTAPEPTAPVPTATLERRLTGPGGRPVPTPAPPASAPSPLPSPTPQPSPLAVSVSASPEEGEPPLAVSFTATASGGTPPYRYLWLFSDGVTASVASLERTFPRVGSREAVVQVRDAAGASVSGRATVRVRLTEPPPDLVVENLRVTPDTGGDDVARSITATIRNVGTTASVPTVAWFTYDLNGDDTPDALPETADVPALTPGVMASIVWRDALRAPVGTHTVEVCADVTKADAEADERNNCSGASFTVTAAPPAAPPPPSVVEPPLSAAKLPNLRMGRSTVSPREPVVGDQPTFTTEVGNIGDRDAPATTVTLTIDSDADGEADAGPFAVAVPPLAVGAWTRPVWERVVTAVVGTHTATFCVDPDDVIAESSTADNCASLDVTVIESPPPPPAGTPPRRRLLY